MTAFMVTFNRLSAKLGARECWNVSWTARGKRHLVVAEEVRCGVALRFPRRRGYATGRGYACWMPVEGRPRGVLLIGEELVTVSTRVF